MLDATHTQRPKQNLNDLLMALPCRVAGRPVLWSMPRHKSLPATRILFPDQQVSSAVIALLTVILRSVPRTHFFSAALPVLLVLALETTGAPLHIRCGIVLVPSTLYNLVVLTSTECPRLYLLDACIELEMHFDRHAPLRVA